MSRVDIENNQGDNRDLTEIKLDSVAEIDQKDEKIKIRTPKRIVHCSDGVYEEYSDEEDGKYWDPNGETWCCGCILLRKNSVMLKIFANFFSEIFFGVFF